MLEFNPYRDKSCSFEANGKPLSQMPSCYLFDNAPFFTKGTEVIVRGEVLKEGKDFIFILPFLEATNRTAQRVYAGVYLHKSVGVIPIIKGVSLGKRYHDINNDVPSKLNGMSLVEIFKLSYDDLIVDSYVPPVKVLFNKDEWYGEEELAQQITLLANTIAEYKEDESIVYGIISYFLATLEKQIYDPRIREHLLARGNVHNHTPEELGARRKDGNAADTNAVFGYNEEELRSLVLSGLPKISELNDKITNLGGRVSKLNLDATFTQLEVSGVTIDRHANQFVLDGDNKQNITTQRSGGVDKLTFKVGDNVLVLNGVTGKIELNGYELITEQNIGQVAGENSSVIGEVITKDTSTIRWVGKGTSSEPLVPSINEDSFKGKGFDKISHSAKKDSILGISPLGAFKVKEKIDNLLPASFTINGLAYTNSFQLDKRNFQDLWRVENISDADLPLTDLARSAISTKSEKLHRHEQSDFTLPLATESTVGIFSYNGVNAAMPTYELRSWWDELNRKTNSASQSIDGKDINVVIYGKGDNQGIVGIIHNQFRMTIPATKVILYGKRLDIGIKVIDIQSLEHNTNRYFYITLNLESLNYNYYLSEEEIPVNELPLGWFYTDSVGIVTYDLRSVVLEINSGTNELHEIPSQNTDHYNMAFTKETLGLTNLVDLPPNYVGNSESEGYATTIGALSLFSPINGLFHFAIKNTPTISNHIRDGVFENWFSSTHPVRQMVQDNPTNIPPDNIVFKRTSGGKTIHVWGHLPQNGFVNDGEAATPNPTYPIGYIYYTSQPYNPTSYLGGVWEKVETLDLEPELRVYYQQEVGTFLESLELIPKNDLYRYIVLVPNQYNEGVSREIVFSDGTEGLEVIDPTSPLNGTRYPYTSSPAGIMVFVLINKVSGILTPLADPKYVWVRTE